MAEPSLEGSSDNEFVVNTILSSVKSTADDSLSQRPTEEVIAKLVSFYEERLNRQKEEMKDEFMRILSSKEKATQSDGQIQCEKAEIGLGAESSGDEKPVGSSGVTVDVVENLSKPANLEDTDVIEVDIRPKSPTKISSSIPFLHMGDFTSPQKSNAQPDIDERSSPKIDEQQPPPPPLDVNSQVLMMMMNVFGTGVPHSGVIFPQEVRDEKLDTPKRQEPEHEPELTPQPNLKDLSSELLEDTESENVRPTTEASFTTDYDPANPLYMKPPSPKNEQESNSRSKQTEDRSSYARLGGTSNEYFSPSASASASIRVQLYEKHQKQIADLKAYYEEELEDLRAKVRQLEQRQSTYKIGPQLNSCYSSKYTNTSPSPVKMLSQQQLPPSSNGVAESDRECASLRLKVEWLDQAYKNATQRLKDAENQVDELATKLSAYTLRVADAGGEIEELHQECRQKDEELDRLVARNSRLLVEVDEAGRMLQIKDQSLAESDAMLNRLMREYQSLNKDFDSLKAKHENCDSLIQDAKQEVTNQKRQMNKLMFEFKRLEHDNDLLTKRLQLTTSFNVAERFGSPPISTSHSAYQIQQAPLSAREFRDRRQEMAPAGLPSSEAHGGERKFSNAYGAKVSFGTAPYALCDGESSDSTMEKDAISRHSGTPQKVAIFRDQGTQAASSRASSVRDDESVLLRAERELFGSKSQQSTTSSHSSKQIGSGKSSPRKMTVSVGTDFAPPIISPSKPMPSSKQTSSSTEQQFDRLLIEKQRVEASLNRLPAAPHNQTIRANKELLERQLEDIEHRLASLRFALKKSQVIRSSLN